MVLHLFRSLATKKEQTHHWGVSALLRQTVNCTEVVYYATIYRTIISVRHSHSLARGNCVQNETAMAALHHLVVVYRYSDIVRAYPFFMNVSEENSQYYV